MAYSDTIDQRMFDFHAFYDRIAEELPNDCRVLESGVASGASALYLAEKLHDLGKTFKLYMVDNMAYGGVHQLNDIIRNVQKSGLSESIEIMAMSSLDASTKFNDNYLHFVFLDSSHEYLQTKAEILLWTQKVSYGSTIAGHDMNEQEGIGVKMAVEELIPRTILRPPIEGQQEFEEEPLLEIVNTTKGLGIWGMQKKFYFHFKM